jgi:crotonobetainyl-CoA:carnitine CoA-transferase CaiB-like acyl-CoA transferase
VTGFVLGSEEQPLAGVRVLDLTRVIAGPVCTRFLGAYGADVLRIDPPGFAEVPALVPEVTPGKRCAALDLRSPAGRLRFTQLVTQAHVVVSGLRRGALPGLGFGPDRLRELNPGLITARLNAYGWDGPWSGRRGFDSLVQMSCGIAHLDADSAPSPLPVQALDHASGYFLAAAVCRALADLVRTGVPSDIRTSLVATANRLMELPLPAGPGRTDPDWPDGLFEAVPTAWGPARRVRVPGTVDGVVPVWSIEAGPLGRHEAAFG